MLLVYKYCINKVKLYITNVDFGLFYHNKRTFLA